MQRRPPFLLLATALLSVVALVSLSACKDNSDALNRFTLVGDEREVVGKVMETKLTACAPEAGKPGTCEGTMVVQPAGAIGPVTVEVTRDVSLKKGAASVFLPQLRDSQVAVKYRASKEGANVVTSVIVQ